MNSIKKAILLTCLAGSVTSMHAGRWDNFKNSCSGLYTACVQSLGNGSNTVSTRVCDAYASCVKAMCNRAHSVATTASNTASTIRDTTVKVTTPVVSAAKTSASGVANAAQFVYEHPLLVGSGISAAAAAYLAHCRNSAALTAKDTEAIAQAMQITEHMFNEDVVPFDKIAYWRFYATEDKRAWNTAADIMADEEAVYADLRLDFGSGSTQSDIAFIDELDKKIDESKKKLAPCLTKLKKALAKYYIVPSTRSVQDRQVNNYVSELVKEYTGQNRAFINLTNDQIETINTKINSKISRSFINPAKIIRRTVLPNEAVVIEQYWKVYQLLQRLNALQACIGNKRMELNGGAQAR